ncbi:MAG TPA: hypothetical protein VFU37_01245 [Pyrinomonadaceae bacterium]|nr:hypothetical protein [Pyrinomonadaceae bacterium]
MTRAKGKGAIAHHLVNRVLPLIVSILTMGISIRADGGNVLWQRTMGSITVTAFSTQSPLRPGPADISFLVENNEQSRPILDAQVFVTFQSETGVTMRTEATHAQARNKLLYCTLIDLPKPGHWKMTLLVVHAAERIEFVSDLAVSEPQSPIMAHWKFMAFPPVIMFLFVINQWLRRNRRASN